MRATTETVIVNLHGDTAQQTVMPESWESEYEQYLASYEQADDKATFNSTYFNKGK